MISVNFGSEDCSIHSVGRKMDVFDMISKANADNNVGTLQVRLDT